ncbi:MAG: hypothetical protein WBL83_21180 [Buttiauxella sp.]
MKHKTVVITLTTLFALLSMPAHAISEKYRQQLERSGCTQLTDGNGCDINKSKAENMRSTDATERQELTSFLRDSVVAQKTDAAYEALTGYGFQNTAPAVWKKGKLTVDLDIQSDMIKHAIVKP